MLQNIIYHLVNQYGDDWLNSIHNQNGMAEDLSILEGEMVRCSRKFGLLGRGMYITTNNEIAATYEVVRPAETLIDLDAVFYAWWGTRASENINYIQREIADDEIIYHFITGTPTHGHSGRVVLMGRNVRNVIRRRLDQRLCRLAESCDLEIDSSESLDTSSNNG